MYRKAGPGLILAVVGVFSCTEGVHSSRLACLEASLSNEPPAFWRACQVLEREDISPDSKMTVLNGPQGTRGWVSTAFRELPKKAARRLLAMHRAAQEDTLCAKRVRPAVSEKSVQCRWLRARCCSGGVTQYSRLRMLVGKQRSRFCAVMATEEGSTCRSLCMMKECGVYGYFRVEPYIQTEESCL